MSYFKWLLDNGHGNNTNGKRSPLFSDGKQLFEFEFNRDIVRRLSELLLHNGIDHYVLVPEDMDISRTQRVKRANNLANGSRCVFLSIHSNAADSASKWSNPSGIETYCFRTGLRAERMAKVFQKHLIEETGWRNREVKTASFDVLKKTVMPAVLTENGFYTNLDECKKLMSDEWRQRIAHAHFEAIMEVENNGV